MMGVRWIVEGTLAASLLFSACAGEPKQDAARPPADLGVSDGSLFIVVDNPPPKPPQDASSDLGPLCQTVSELAYDSGVSPVPLDWQTAQSLSAWCGMYQANPPTSLCLIPNSDGYNQAVISYFEGGEMPVVWESFYLYDPATGKLVASLSAETYSVQVTCWFRTPDGPANPTVYSDECREGMPLQPACAADAGSTN
jgi:hypothetical protein